MTNSDFSPDELKLLKTRKMKEKIYLHIWTYRNYIDFSNKLSDITDPSTFSQFLE